MADTHAASAGIAAASRTSPERGSYRLPKAGLRVVLPANVRAARQPDGGTAETALDGEAATVESRLSDASLANALRLDRALLDAAAQDARCRYAQARLMSEFLSRKAWQPLTFSHPGDYTAERLGLKLSTVERDVQVVRTLASLPAIEAALQKLQVTWTHARLLIGSATPANEAELLALARANTTRRFEQLLKERREQDAASLPDPVADGEPMIRWSIPVTREGSQLVRGVCEMASRVAGAQLPTWKAFELAAAEVLAGCPRHELAEQPPPPADTAAARAEADIIAFEKRHGCCEGAPGLQPPPEADLLTPEIQTLLDGAATADAFELDERLRKLQSKRQHADSHLGALLHRFAEAGHHKRLGFANLELYMRGRLGISTGKGFALKRLAGQSARKSPGLDAAYREGRISALAATTLIPILGTEYDAAWIDLASACTLRHLMDAVSWALDRRDDPGGRLAQPPPPFGINLRNEALARLDPRRLQMRAGDDPLARDLSRAASALVVVRAPASVVALLEQAIESCRRPGELPWRAFERMLARAYLAWRALPKHRDPIFEREGYRCAVPGCTRRAQLEDHHRRFRSAGGGDELTNRLAVCAWHHHCAVHERRMRILGLAPDQLLFEFGCRPDHEPLMRLAGERYLRR